MSDTPKAIRTDESWPGHGNRFSRTAKHKAIYELLEELKKEPDSVWLMPGDKSLAHTLHAYATRAGLKIQTAIRMKNGQRMVYIRRCTPEAIRSSVNTVDGCI